MKGEDPSLRPASTPAPSVGAWPAHLHRPGWGGGGLASVLAGQTQTAGLSVCAPPPGQGADRRPFSYSSGIFLFLLGT